MSRDRTTTVRCCHEGCTETTRLQLPTRDEARRILYRGHKWHGTDWKCLRHSSPESVLAPDAGSRTVTLVVAEVPHGRYWQWPSGKLDSGFLHGPGFKAWASDFEPGTTLTITATIVLAGEE